MHTRFRLHSLYIFWMFGEFKLGKSFLEVQDSKLHTPLKVVEFYAKGGLISESFSLWLKSHKKGAKKYVWHKQYPPK
jgi:hypothetical protein